MEELNAMGRPRGRAAGITVRWMDDKKEYYRQWQKINREHKNEVDRAYAAAHAQEARDRSHRIRWADIEATRRKDRERHEAKVRAEGRELMFRKGVVTWNEPEHRRRLQRRWNRTHKRARDKVKSRAWSTRYRNKIKKWATMSDVELKSLNLTEAAWMQIGRYRRLLVQMQIAETTGDKTLLRGLPRRLRQSRKQELQTLVSTLSSIPL